MRLRSLPAALGIAALSLSHGLVQAQETAPAEATPAPAAEAEPVKLAPVAVTASADASQEGLSPAFSGGQVAQGGRAGILGTRDHLETPFSITSYTNELIQDRQARSVGDVLQNDPTVRTARGFGNFQESYFIRGFILGSDDVAYNGLYSLLPRQYIATELFERVEVLRGASAFLNGANPGGGGLGGAINLLPKRAPNEPLTRLTVGYGAGDTGNVAMDVARRFGSEQQGGVRVNAAYRDGGTAVDDEGAKLGLVSVGADWRGSNFRISGDLGWQDNQLEETRTNVSLVGVTRVPDAPKGSSNFAQPWTYSDERDLFGTLRGEYDFTPDLTAWAAYGMRRSDEANSLANLTVTNDNGDGGTNRFDNTREDEVDTGELGLRGKLRTGPVAHEWVISASWFELDKATAYAYNFASTQAINLYNPVYSARPPLVDFGNELDNPARTGRTRLKSLAVGDTLSMLDERLLITLGARHQSLVIDNYSYENPATPAAEGGVLGRYDESRVSPLGGVVYRVTPQLSVYANYVEGLTQGDTAPGNPLPGGGTISNPGDTLKPYVSKQQEVGAKFENDRIGLGLALFSTTRPRSLIANGAFTSEGEDRHQGAELTVYGTVTRDLRLLGGLTWLDTEQRKTGNAATQGNQVIGVPELQATLGAEWDVTALRGLAVDGRVVYTGSRYADDANTLEAPSWTRLDLGSRYLTELGGRLFTFRARVDNVLDKDYWASVGGYPGAGYLVAGGPRSLVLSVSTDF
ncbi:MAG TPA: TonB-dependent receptor [Solimonas sp.]